MHEAERDRHDGSLLPAAKRKKIAGGEQQSVDEAETSRERQTTRTMPEFRAESLDDFYKPCPNYRLPVELGAFSFDDEGKFCHDRSQLRYYHPPCQVSKLLMPMDLKVGYEKFVPKAKSGAPDLEPILRWITVNGHCFKPRNEPLSPNNGTSVDSSATYSPTANER